MSVNAYSELLKDYLTEAQLSVETGRCVRQLRSMRQGGNGPPFVKFGSTVLYSRDAFLEWLKSMEQKPRRPIGRRKAA